MMGRKKQLVCLVFCVLVLALNLGLAGEDEKAPPFAAELSSAKFSHASYNTIVFGRLIWQKKGKAVKSPPPAVLSWVRDGDSEQIVTIKMNSDGVFVVQQSPGPCELRAVFSQGRWFNLGHSFSLEKGTVCYAGDITLDLGAESIDYYDYRFTIDAEMKPKKFNKPDSAWTTAFRVIPADFKSQEGQVNIFIPAASANIQSVKREEKTLIKAADLGDMATVEEFIAAKRPLDAVDDKQRTPLMAALQAKETAIAERLLAAGGSLKAKDVDGWTPLMFALGFSNPEIAKKMIEMGADVLTISTTGWTALHLATRYNQSENARLLIAKGANILSKTDKGETALSYALQYGEEDLALFLLDKGAEVNAVESEGWSPLMTALRYAKPKVARRLIDNGADITRVNNEGWSILLMAIRNDHRDFALELISKGVDASTPNKSGFAPLHFAANNGQLEVVTALLAKKVPINPVTNEGWTPLHKALFEEKSEVALLLLQKGADLTKKTVNGWNPLLLALRHNQAEAARLLIQKGAGLMEESPDGWNALMLALRYNQAESAKLLINRNAGINNKNKDGWTPLMLALRYDQAMNASLMLEKKADPNTALPNGWTALHFAIEYGQPENARILISKGASKTALTPEGKSPIELAQAKGYSEIVRLLGGAPSNPVTGATPAPQPAASTWLPGLMGQFIPSRPGAKILSADECGPNASVCGAKVELPGSKTSALNGFKQDLLAAGWRLDQALSAPSEGASMGNANMWGLLNMIKDQFNITMLFLSNQTSGGKTVVDISLINRNPGFDVAAFVNQIPRILITPTVPTKRFLASPWAFTMRSATWCGRVIEKDVGFGAAKYTYTVQGESLDLLKLQLFLERMDNIPIKDQFMKIDLKLRDMQGNLYSPVAAGTKTGDYFNLSQGGMQEALIPMQPSSEMDWVFALPRGSVIDALLWPGIEAISLRAK